MLKALGRAA